MTDKTLEQLITNWENSKKNLDELLSSMNICKEESKALTKKFIGENPLKSNCIYKKFYLNDSLKTNNNVNDKANNTLSAINIYYYFEGSYICIFNYTNSNLAKKYKSKSKLKNTTSPTYIWIKKDTYISIPILIRVEYFDQNHNLKYYEHSDIALLQDIAEVKDKEFPTSSFTITDILKIKFNLKLYYKCPIKKTENFSLILTGDIKIR